MKKLLLSLAILLFATITYSQTIFIDENFSGPNTPLGWTNSITSGNMAWSFGIDGSQTSIGNGNLNGTTMAYFDDDGLGSAHLNNTVELKTPSFNNSSTILTYLSFHYNFYHISGTSEFFKVEVFDGSNWNTVLKEVQTNCGELNFGGCVGNYPKANIDISAYKNANCQIRFTYHDGDDWAGYIGLDDVKVFSDTGRSLPYIVDFENIGNPGNIPIYANDFRNTSLFYNWHSDRGINVNGVTGPSADHTLGTNMGTYMVTDGASGISGNIVTLTSPLINIDNTTNLTLSYWYHMFGVDMGNLYLEVNYNQNWVRVDSLIGENPNQSSGNTAPWIQKTLSLSPPVTAKTMRYRFYSVHGGYVATNMAIDDIKVEDVTVTSATEVSESKDDFLIYPNPSNGKFIVDQNFIHNKTFNFQILDMLGAIVYEGSLTNSNNQIDLQNQPKGVYFLKIENSSFIKKLVIQ